MEEVNASGQSTTKQVTVSQMPKADTKAQDQQPVKKKTQKVKKVVKKSGVKSSAKNTQKVNEEGQLNHEQVVQGHSFLQDANSKLPKASGDAQKVSGEKIEGEQGKSKQHSKAKKAAKQVKLESSKTNLG